MPASPGRVETKGAELPAMSAMLEKSAWSVIAKPLYPFGKALAASSDGRSTPSGVEGVRVEVYHAYLPVDI